MPRVLMRPLLWALALGSLVGYAVYAFLNISTEVLPEFNFPQISVFVNLPGATATELESLIVYPLEGQILGLPDLKSVRASMGAGMWFSGRGGVVGVSNHTNFLRATRSGTLSIEATPIHRGRTQQLWLVEISNEEGKAVARGEVRLANITDQAQIGG